MPDQQTTPSRFPPGSPQNSPSPPPLPPAKRPPVANGALLRETGKDMMGAASGGFVARLGGVTLADLIRFECLRRSRCVLRVSSRGQAGYLYFRDGALVHAATAVATGAEAVRELLEWRSGSVESGVGTWPAHETITMPWEDLLRGAGDTASFLSVSATRDSVSLTQARTRTHEAERGRATSKRAKAEATVVMAPTGELIQGPANPTGLPEAASYAAHMAELIGGFLGFDRFCALEANYGGEQLLVGRGQDGNLVARREKNPADLEDLRHVILAGDTP
ncbi:MAG TPA: DUF4388 domain-containing protein [Polyangia bacterium]